MLLRDPFSPGLLLKGSMVVTQTVKEPSSSLRHRWRLPISLTTDLVELGPVASEMSIVSKRKISQKDDEVFRMKSNILARVCSVFCFEV